MAVIREKVTGCNVDSATFDEFVECISDCIKSQKSLHIVTINPEMAELASKNKDFAEVLNNAETVIPDGSGIRLALRLKGIKQEPVTGIDLAKAVLNVCSNNGFPVAFIGAKKEVVNKSVENLKSEFKSMNVVYQNDGYFSADDESFVIENLKNSGAKFVLVALGAPKQEFFIKKCREKISDAVFIGVGGSFDVWAGNVERAPRIFRIFGCEWLFRVIKQPSRIKRIYKTLPIFLVKIIMEKVGFQKGKRDD